MVHKVLFWSGFGMPFKRRLLALGVHTDDDDDQALPFDYGSSALKCDRSSSANLYGRTRCMRVLERHSVTG